MFLNTLYRFLLAPFLAIGAWVEKMHSPTTIRFYGPGGMIECEYGRECKFLYKYASLPMDNEIIIASAVRHPSGLIFSVKQGRHKHCIAAMAYKEMAGIANTRYQGFLTNHGRYVSREEACFIARQAGQLKKSLISDTFSSEDLWEIAQPA